MMTKTGTVAFSAPEIFESSFYSEKVDVWAAGIVLYMMLLALANSIFFSGYPHLRNNGKG